MVLGAVLIALAVLAAPSALASSYTPNNPSAAPYVPDNPGHWILRTQNEIGSHSTYPYDYQWFDDTVGKPTLRFRSAAQMEGIVQRNLAMVDEATGQSVAPTTLESDAATTAADDAQGSSMWDGLANAADAVKTRAMGFLEKAGEWAGVDSLSGAVPVLAEAAGTAYIGWQIGSGIADLLGLNDSGGQDTPCADCDNQTSDIWSGGVGTSLTVCDVGEPCGTDPTAGYQEYAATMIACGDLATADCPAGENTGHGGPSTWAVVTDPPGSRDTGPGWSGCMNSSFSPFGGFYPSEIINVPPVLSPVYEFGGSTATKTTANECDYNSGQGPVPQFWVNHVSFLGPVDVACLPGPGQNCPTPTTTIHGPNITRPSPTQAQQNVENCLTSATDAGCQAWNGTFCDLSGSGCEGIPPVHQTGPGLVTIPQPNGYEDFTQYEKDLTSAGITATPTEDVLSDAEANTSDAPDAVVTTDPAPGNQVSPTTVVKVMVNPSELTASGGPSVVGPTPPGLSIPQPGTPCNVFPFGAPCWLQAQVGQFTSATPTAPSFSIGVPSIAGGGNLNVNLDHPFGADLSAIMAVVRVVLLVLSAIGLMLWLVTFAHNGGTGNAGSGDDG